MPDTKTSRAEIEKDVEGLGYDNRIRVTFVWVKEFNEPGYKGSVHHSNLEVVRCACHARHVLERGF